MQCNVAGTRSNSLHAFSFVALLCVVYREFSHHSVHSRFSWSRDVIDLSFLLCPKQLYSVIKLQ